MPDPLIIMLLWTLVGIYMWYARITKFSRYAGLAMGIIGTLTLAVKALGPFV